MRVHLSLCGCLASGKERDAKGLYSRVQNCFTSDKYADGHMPWQPEDASDKAFVANGISETKGSTDR